MFSRSCISKSNFAFVTRHTKNPNSKAVFSSSFSSTLPLQSFSTTTPSPSSSSSSQSSSSFETVGVVGLGLMGHGICQTAATAASSPSSSTRKIIAYEPHEDYLNRGRDRITSSLNKLVAREKLSSESADEILNSITFTTDMEELSQSDLIIEAVIENMDLKKDIYTSLHEICPDDTIFASNTSSLSITEMADIFPSENRKSNFLGLHFFNPVQIMKLVEVIHTDYTNMDVFDRVRHWVEHDINKAAVKCGDTPGFIVNRLLVPSLMQALAMVDRGDASVRDIDLSMKLGAGHPMGPIHLADYIGLDTCLFIVEGWVENFPNEPAFIIPKCLKDKVEAGDLGRKTGKGFYVWDGEKRGDPV